MSLEHKNAGVKFHYVRAIVLIGGKKLPAVACHFYLRILLIFIKVGKIFLSFYEILFLDKTQKKMKPKPTPKEKKKRDIYYHADDLEIDEVEIMVESSGLSSTSLHENEERRSSLDSCLSQPIQRSSSPRDRSHQYRRSSFQDDSSNVDEHKSRLHSDTDLSKPTDYERSSFPTKVHFDSTKKSNRRKPSLEQQDKQSPDRSQTFIREVRSNSKRKSSIASSGKDGTEQKIPDSVSSAENYPTVPETKTRLHTDVNADASMIEHLINVTRKSTPGDIVLESRKRRLPEDGLGQKTPDSVSSAKNYPTVPETKTRLYIEVNADESVIEYLTNTFGKSIPEGTRLQNKKKIPSDGGSGRKTTDAVSSANSYSVLPAIEACLQTEVDADQSMTKELTKVPKKTEPQDGKVFQNKQRRSSLIQQSFQKKNGRKLESVEHDRKSEFDQDESKIIVEKDVSTQIEKICPKKKVVKNRKKKVSQFQHSESQGAEKRPISSHPSMVKESVEPSSNVDSADEKNGTTSNGFQRVEKTSFDQKSLKESAQDLTDALEKNVDMAKCKPPNKKVINNRRQSISKSQHAKRKVGDSGSSLKSTKSSSNKLERQVSEKKFAIDISDEDISTTPVRSISHSDKTSSDQDNLKKITRAAVNNQTKVAKANSTKLNGKKAVNEKKEKTSQSGKWQSAEGLSSSRSNEPTLNELMKQSLEEMTTNVSSKKENNNGKFFDPGESNKVSEDYIGPLKEYAHAENFKPDDQEIADECRLTETQLFKPSQLPQSASKISNSNAHEPTFDKLQELSDEQIFVINKENGNDDSTSFDQENVPQNDVDNLNEFFFGKLNVNDEKSRSSDCLKGGKHSLYLHRGSLEDLAKHRSERLSVATDGNEKISEQEAAKKIVERTKKRVALKTKLDSKKGATTRKRRTSLSSALKQISISRRGSINEEDEKSDSGENSCVSLQDKDRTSIAVFASDSFFQRDYDYIFSQYEDFEYDTVEMEEVGKPAHDNIADDEIFSFPIPPCSQTTRDEDDAVFGSLMPKRSQSTLIQNDLKLYANSPGTSSYKPNKGMETSSSFSQPPKPVVSSQSPGMIESHQPFKPELSPHPFGQRPDMVEFSVENLSGHFSEKEESMSLLAVDRDSLMRLIRPGSQSNSVSNELTEKTTIDQNIPKIVQVPTNVLHVINVAAGKSKAENKKVPDDQNESNSSYHSKSSPDQNAGTARSSTDKSTVAGETKDNNINSLVDDSQVLDEAPDDQSED